jgi:outer membrane lipoprotein-sorting protein
MRAKKGARREKTEPSKNMRRKTMKNAKKLLLLLLSLVLLVGVFAVAVLAEEETPTATVTYPDGTVDTYTAAGAIKTTIEDGLYYGKGNTLYKDNSGNGWIYTNENGEAVFVVKEKALQKMTIMGLPVGCKYTVTEQASDHVASYALSSTASNPSFARQSASNTINRTELSTATETLDKKDETVTITFTNTRNAAPVTGHRERWDWLVSAVLGLLLLTFCLFRKEANRHDK